MSSATSRPAKPNSLPSVFNRQRRTRIDSGELRAFLARLAERLQAGSFSVVLVSDRAMADYNRRFRGREGPADVLSFPDELSPGEEETGYLGDIIVSAESADRQKRSARATDEVKALCLHGLLHLLGYDHETDRGEMEALEAELRKELGLI